MINSNKAIFLITIIVLMFIIVIVKTSESKNEKNKEFIESVIISELYQWFSESDGVCFYYIVPRLFDKNLLYPNLFYSQMAENKVLFDEYLYRLDPAVFTNLKDTTTKHLEVKRIESLNILKNKQIDKKYLEQHNKLISTLDTIRVSFID